MRRVKILHVLGNLNRGGAETLIMNWYRNIDRERFQFDFVIHTNEKCSYTEEILKMGGKIYSFPSYNGKNHFYYYRCWEKFFLEHPEYKIIHGHVRSTASIYLQIAKKFNRTTISHSHSTNSGFGIIGVIKYFLQYPIRYVADYKWACSLEAGKYLFGKNIIKDKNFKVIKNAIDIKKFNYNENMRKSIREKLKLSNEFVIGHIGRFCQEKNHKFILEVFEKYRKFNPNSRLVLIGKGPLLNEIKKMAFQKRIEKNIIFMGEQDYVENLIQGMDVLLFPSIHEGLGIVTIEAQATGLRVLASNNIPKEVRITNLLEFFSINKKNDSDLWRDRLIEITKNKDKRKTQKLAIEKSGYSIKEEIKKLEKEYLKMEEKYV